MSNIITNIPNSLWNRELIESQDWWNTNKEFRAGFFLMVVNNRPLIMEEYTTKELKDFLKDCSEKLQLRKDFLKDCKPYITLEKEIAKREKEEAATKSKIRYEWHSLELDNNQDIINITIHDNFIDAMNDSIDVNNYFENGSVELVKYYMDGYDIDGETRSAWCSNSLDISDSFDDGSDVPKYLKKQIINEVRTWECEE